MSAAGGGGSAEAGSGSPSAGIADLLHGVRGWCSLRQAQELSDLVANHPAPGLYVVEVGTFEGRSTLALAHGVLRRLDARLLSVDPHRGNLEHQRLWGEVDTWEAARRNLKRVPSAVVTLRRDTSVHAANTSGRVDVLYVDGSHEYHEVLQDLVVWQGHLAPGSVVALDDVPWWLGVYRAARAVVLRRHSPFRNPYLCENMLVSTYLPHLPWRRRDDAKLARVLAQLQPRHARMLAHGGALPYRGILS